MMRLRSSKIGFLGIFTTIGLMLSYIESLFMIPIRVPGIKIGLSNLITVVILYLMGPLEAFFVLIARVILSGILFGNASSVIYSIAGALISFCFMILLKKTNVFSEVGVSVIGGVSHNIAQLFMAIILTGSVKVLYYAPALAIFGCIAGIIIGFISIVIIRRLKKLDFSNHDL